MLDELLKRRAEQRRARVAEARLHRLAVEGMADSLASMQRTLKTREAELTAKEAEIAKATRAAERARRQLAEARAELVRLRTERRELEELEPPDAHQQRLDV